VGTFLIDLQGLDCSNDTFIMRKDTVRRLLIAMGAFIAVFITFGLVTSLREPIERTFGQSGRELESAMDWLSDRAIACSREGSQRGPIRLRGCGDSGSVGGG
jgi:hypothetical protein